MNGLILLWIILLPAAFGVLTLLTPKGFKGGKEAVLLLGFTGNLVMNILACGKEMIFERPFAGFGIDFTLKLYPLSGFILISAAALSFLVALYTTVFMKGKSGTKLFYACMLFTMALVNGAVLANNLTLLLFFWEGILATMFVMILQGGKKAYKTSAKAVVIAGLSDLTLMLGIGLTGYIAKTSAIDQIRLPITGWGMLAFLLLIAGAVSKAGSMPFHTWIPDAADDAPMPFLSFLPGALNKLLGIYLLTRVCLNLFEFANGSTASWLIMVIGAATMVFAAMMALVQTDFKRLLSYCAISQVGYMIMGIGTGLFSGIAGGVYHVLNDAVYMCCLFFTAGAVEKQAGTTDLRKIGGLGKKMPVTFACFIAAAASVAGFPLTGGFFSKEMIFEAALNTNVFLYIAAAVGAFFTAVAFLKLGHAVFLGKPAKETEKVREAPTLMLIPMVVLAVACLTLGFGKNIMTGQVLQPVLGVTAQTGEYTAGGINWLLAGISVALLLLALWDHCRGFKTTGAALSSADHYHDAPVLKTVYGLAAKKYFDPYHLGGYLIRSYATLSLKINDGISWFYDVAVVRFVGWLSMLVKWAHNGSQSRYVLWILTGTAVVTAMFLLSM
jgi:formate hydrogenlyase subunit 3/multisubunit Na+/H+ antiporter MnhD subunit